MADAALAGHADAADVRVAAGQCDRALCSRRLARHLFVRFLLAFGAVAGFAVAHDVAAGATKNLMAVVHTGLLRTIPSGT